jgi:FlaA1/EpsC-like NDP-sugar epimerase
MELLNIDDEALASRVLRRPLVEMPVEPLRALVAGRRVLVTGAGGFIGSALSRLLAGLGVGLLCLLDHAENALYQADLDLQRSSPKVRRRAICCDVRDSRALGHRFAEVQPELVFHAAALKQLPLMEEHLREAVLTNTLGARNVIDAAAACGAATTVLISTDKAVRPESVLGATKRLAEAWCQTKDVESTAGRFVAIRFGNVFGSSGSVAPLFRRQILAGGPVTLTDTGMRRYFMTAREAAELVLAAAAMASAEHAPRGAVYALETGEPVAIADVARRLIEESRRDVPIVCVGARPGERLVEPLFDEGEHWHATDMPAIRRAGPSTWSAAIMRHQLAELERACEQDEEDRLARLIGRYVPTFAGSRSGAVVALAGATP